MKIDAGMLCFSLVVLCATPVAILRTQTYRIGYELSALKQKERQLREQQKALDIEFFQLKNTLYKKYGFLKWPPYQDVVYMESCY